MGYDSPEARLEAAAICTALLYHGPRFPRLSFLTELSSFSHLGGIVGSHSSLAVVSRLIHCCTRSVVHLRRSLGRIAGSQSSPTVRNFETKLEAMGREGPTLGERCGSRRGPPRPPLHRQGAGARSTGKIPKCHNTVSLVALNPLVPSLSTDSVLAADRCQLHVGLQRPQHKFFADAHDGQFQPWHSPTLEAVSDAPETVTYVLAQYCYPCRGTAPKHRQKTG